MDLPNDKKKNTILVIILLIPLLLLLFFVGYYYELNKNGSHEVGVEPLTEEEFKEIVKPLTFRQSNPVRKSIGGDLQFIRYWLVGYLRKGFKTETNFSDGRIRGTFVLKNDPLEREIPIIYGLSGQVYLGVFNGSFEASSSWMPKDNAYILEETKENEEVVVQLYFEAKGADFPMYQELLDGLYYDYENNEHKTQIPEGFELYPDGLAIAR